MNNDNEKSEDEELENAFEDIRLIDRKLTLRHCFQDADDSLKRLKDSPLLDETEAAIAKRAMQMLSDIRASVKRRHSDFDPS